MSTETNHSKIKRIRLVIAILLLVILLFAGTGILINSHRTAQTATAVKNGLSAYELAVANGYDGSIQDWLDSLNGKSAYEIAKDNGYTGTEEKWTKSLQATAEKGGESVKSASFSKDGELLITLSDGTVLNAGQAVGAKGADGAKGDQGKKGDTGDAGINGKDGVGVSSAKVNSDGQLILNSRTEVWLTLTVLSE